MTLHIVEQSGIDLIPFMEQCISHYFLTTIRAKFNVDILKNYTDEFDVEQYKKVLFNANFLRAYQVGETHFILDINPKIMIGDKSFLACCSLIDSGTLTTQSYPIFSKTFDSFYNNFWSYYKYFWRG